MSTDMTKTWFDGTNIITQEIPEAEIYKREWVGLTDEEIWSTVSRIGTADSNVNPYTVLNDARRIEALLKAKNT